MWVDVVNVEKERPGLSVPSSYCQSEVRDSISWWQCSDFFTESELCKPGCRATNDRTERLAKIASLPFRVVLP